MLSFRVICLVLTRLPSKHQHLIYFKTEITLRQSCATVNTMSELTSIAILKTKGCPFLETSFSDMM